MMWNVSTSRLVKTDLAKPDPAVAALCPECSLCCNGVLFVDVRLQEGDDATRLARLGLTLRRAATSPRFAQPCACLEAKLCRIYEERPGRCRAFECRLLQRVKAGEIDEKKALNSIRRAQRSAEWVKEILRQLGDNDDHIPLTKRYQRMMQQAIDLSANKKHIGLRGELMTAVGRLVSELERNFLR